MTQGDTTLTLVFGLSTEEENLSLNSETRNIVLVDLKFVPWVSLLSHSKLKKEWARLTYFLNLCQMHCFRCGFVQTHGLKLLPKAPSASFGDSILFGALAACAPTTKEGWRCLIKHVRMSADFLRIPHLLLPSQAPDLKCISPSFLTSLSWTSPCIPGMQYIRMFWKWDDTERNPIVQTNNEIKNKMEPPLVTWRISHLSILFCLINIFWFLHHLLAFQKGSPDLGVSSLDSCNPTQKDTHFHIHM